MRIRMVVFDIAGTTVSDEDNAVAGRLCDALRAVGVDIAETDVDPYMGMPKPLAIERLLSDHGGERPSEERVLEIHADFQRRMIDHYKSSPTVQQVPGAAEVFAFLRSRGIRVTLDTGFDRPITDAILERLGWAEKVIDDSVTSDEVARGRPSPDMIHVLMERAGITDPQHVAKVGDSGSDVEQGLAAGCGLVAAVLGPRTVHLVDQHADVEAIETIADFPLLLERLAAHEVTTS